MLGDHHRDFALLFMCFIRRVNQLHTIAMIKFTRFLVVYVREETQMRLRINWRRISNRFTAAALVTGKTRSIQHVSSFTAELV